MDNTLIKSLVGEITGPQINNLIENFEFHLHPDLSLFVPIYRHCEYATTPNHSHPSYSFIYYIKPLGHILVNGTKKYFPNNTSSFICGFSPGVLHQEVLDEGFSNYIAILIKADFFEQELSKHWDMKNVNLEGEMFPANEKLLYLLKLLMIEHNQQINNSEQVIHSLNNLVVSSLTRTILGAEDKSINVGFQNKIDIAIAYMYENIDRKISVEQLAANADMSASHFTKVFKDLTNKTPIEYLNKIRIEKAKRLLKLPDKNLSEIAYDCGFSSPSYFSRSFLQDTKLSPSDYRSKFSSPRE